MEAETNNIEAKDSIKEALMDSTIGLFGIYRNKQGKEFICCNGGKFQSID